ncbi:hypothetical protein SISSUDRAFT_1067651 [Sistotremastrum suecicum HHB10207 ss-3]|uniref:Uncharacterized protein n=1 Tax=Sistotremastrum suecicum HHB10207 ss-3 TaxID=1314776 RepID=A0A165WW07_9AGAM|nr:hypothetical protein SISSUDRAFT_1067651 [Sistotremastrum suecicum HHB10207 ss-3]
MPKVESPSLSPIARSRPYRKTDASRRITKLFETGGALDSQTTSQDFIAQLTDTPDASMWDHLGITQFSPPPTPRASQLMNMPKVESERSNPVKGGPNWNRDRIINEAERDILSALGSLKLMLATMESPPTPSQEIARLKSLNNKLASDVAHYRHLYHEELRQSRHLREDLDSCTCQEPMLAYSQLPEGASSPVRGSSVGGNSPDKRGRIVMDEWVPGQKERESQMVPPMLELEGYDAVWSVIMNHPRT